MAERDEPHLGGPSSEDAGADAPLLREIQRVLLSSTGPVNWELARQIGIASASWSGEDPAPTDDDRRSFEEAVRLAELKVQGFTGLEPPHDLPRIDPVRRGQWVQANIEGLKAVVEPAASKLAEAVGRAQGEAPLAETAGFASQMVRQLSPLLLGAQVGSVLGYLAQHVLGQYDIALPRSDSPALLFVVPNIAAFERDWSLPPTDFRTWVALHEVTHRFEFARPWALGRFRSLLEDFLSTVELDIKGLQTRLESLDMSDPQAMQDMLQGEEGLFGAVLDQEQRLKLGRIQAFMASAEGYGDHVTHAIGRELLSSYGRIEEAMRRYRETEQGDPVFERLLGIEMKREQYRLGRAFCDAVAELSDEATLARMWDSAESLPSLPELAEPRLWLARTV
jgi:putative hydrolase